MYLFALSLGFLVSLAILVYYVKTPAFSLFHPLTIYSAFHFLVFVIRPVAAYWYGFSDLYSAYRFMPSLSDKVTVIAAANLGYLAFAIASLYAGNVAVQFRTDAASLLERRQLVRAFIWVVCLCVPIAIYSLTKNFAGEGGTYDGMVVDSATGTTINTKTNGYLTGAQLMLAPLCAIIAWLGRFRPVSLLPMAGFVLFSGSSGGRGPFIAALVMLLLLYLYEKRIRYPAMRLVLAGAALATLFSWVGEDRGKAMRQITGLGGEELTYSTGAVELRPLESMDLANMEFFEYVVWVVPQRSGTYDYFLNNLQLFTEPIPRVLWSGKPVGPPFQPVRLWDYGKPIGMTYSLPGAGWFSLGWAGVVIWCGLWGFASGYVYRRFWQGDQSTLKTASYMIFVAILVLGYRDGSIVSVAKQVFAYMVPLAIWYLIARYMNIPTLARIRALTSRRQRQGAPGSPRPASSPLRTRRLPAAVVRRRMALENGPEPSTKE